MTERAGAVLRQQQNLNQSNLTQQAAQNLAPPVYIVYLIPNRYHPSSSKDCHNAPSVLILSTAAANPAASPTVIHTHAGSVTHI